MRSLRRGLVCGLLVVAGLVPAGRAGADAADRPGAVTHDSASNKTIVGRLASASDEDWYRFTLRRPTWIMARLTRLPANLQLAAFDARGDRLATSTRPWRQFEEVYRHFDAGTYYLQVASQGGEFSRSGTYHLRFERLARGMPALTFNTWTYPRGYSYFTVAVDMLNNTPKWQIVIDISVDLIDGAGVVYAHGGCGASPDVVGPRRHFLCAADFNKPLRRRLDHVHVVVTRHQETPYRSWPLSVHPTRSNDGPYGTEFHGYLRNDGSTTIHDPRVNLVFYGTGARLLDAQSSYATDIRRLAPGASHRYLVYSHRVGPRTFFRAWTLASGGAGHL